MGIIIGADVVPTNSNLDLFAAGNAEDLIGLELKGLLSSADYRIFNLEVPLTDNETPIEKWGPNLTAPTRTIHGYQAMGIDLLTLANNHIMDQGAQGYRSTIKTLDAAGIAHVGAGDDLAEASKPYQFCFSGKTVGVYACAEHEFSIATESSCGANPFDPLWSLDHVEQLKKCCDYVIVLYHGGKEHYRYPSPGLQKVCRRLVDKGANLVICQHSHCIGCEEKYKDGTIVYGQGNFLFDDEDNEFWRTSLLIEITEDWTISYHPIVKVNNCVRLADEKQEKEIMDAFALRTEEIQDPKVVEEKYAGFANTMLSDYLTAFAGKRTLVERVLNRISHGRYTRLRVKKKYEKKDLLRLCNYIECEAHRELIDSGIEKSSRGEHDF
ncbi:MAG: CapA family protein [Ruminococcaceae bacterium]|nr:CapA family protein [Oscillospiraceae bacterium]